MAVKYSPIRKERPSPKTGHLDVEEVEALCRTMSYQEVARHYKLPWSTFKHWLHKQRKKGHWI